MSKSILIRKQLLINNIALSATKQMPIGLANLIKEYLFYDKGLARQHTLFRDIMFSLSTYFLCTSRANPNGAFYRHHDDITLEEEIYYSSRCEQWVFVVTDFDHRYHTEVKMHAINCSTCGGYIACQTAITDEIPHRIKCDGHRY